MGAADRDFSLLLVVHAELIAGLEPRHDLADLVNVDDEAAMSAPKARGVEEFEKLLKGAALGLALEDPRDDANNPFIDGSEADVGLIDEQEAALRLNDELGGRTALLGGLRAIEKAQKAIDLRFDADFRRGARSGAAGRDAGFGAVDGFRDTDEVKGFEQVVDGVHVERADGVLVISGGEDELGQRRDVFLGTGFCGSGAVAVTVAVDEPLNHGKAVLPGHLDIEKDEIGMVFIDKVDGLNAVRSLGDDVDVADGIEQILQLVAGQLFVVDDER